MIVSSICLLLRCHKVVIVLGRYLGSAVGVGRIGSDPATTGGNDLGRQKPTPPPASGYRQQATNNNAENSPKFILSSHFS